MGRAPGRVPQSVYFGSRTLSSAGPHRAPVAGSQAHRAYTVPRRTRRRGGTSSFLRAPTAATEYGWAVVSRA